MRRLLILLVMVGFGIDAGLLGARFVHPFSYTAIGISVLGGLALSLLLIVMPLQAVRVLKRGWIAGGLFFKRRLLRRLVNAERVAMTRTAEDVTSPSALADLSVAEYLRGSLGTAEVDLVTALEMATETPCAANNLGVMLADQGQHERAAELFAQTPHDCAEEMALNCALLAPLLQSPARLEELTTSSGQPNATAFNNIGVSYARHDDWAAGAQWFARAIETAPQLPAARANLGLDAFRRGQLQEAADNIMLANRQEPNEPAFANYLGAILAAAGQTDQARFYFRRAYRVDPASLAIRLNMSAAEALGGHWQVAQKGFRALVGSQERGADIHYNLAVTDLAVQDATSAAANASSAIALGDSSADAYTVLAVALWETGRRGEALSHFATANEAPGAGSVAASNLGRALLLEGQPDRALAVLETARAQWPDDAHLELDMATAILAQGASQYSDGLRPEQRQPILDWVQRSYAALEDAIKREGEGTAEAHVNMGL
ncbi:MAG: tetratricopeptide repeat protein, partial [Bacteroidota bacterium]